MLYELEDEWGNLTTVESTAPHVRPERVRPLRQGQSAPMFDLPAPTEGVWNGTLTAFAQREVPATSLDVTARRPLVLSFYCPCWGAYARPHLEMLRSHYANIRALGGELLVLTNEPPAVIRRLVERQGLPFSMVHDAENALAAQFGVYSATHPLWDRIAGISEDAYTPAVYVLNRRGRIVFDFVDENLEYQPEARALLRAVYESK
jgi:peroxiredoxin